MYKNQYVGIKDFLQFYQKLLPVLINDTILELLKATIDRYQYVTGHPDLYLS